MRSPRLACSALSLLLVATIQAQVTNGGFETGNLTGWTSTGTAAVQGTFNSQAPNQGSFQAVIRTPQGGTTLKAPLESFLGLASGSLDAFGTIAGGFNNGGSAIKQAAITVAAGAMIQFAWNFLPNGSNSVQNDSLLMVLHLASVTANSSAVTQLDRVSNHPTGMPSGYSLFTTGPLAAGTYLLAFVAFDIEQPAGQVNFQRPDALIDSVSVINPTAPGVPDSGGTIALLGLAGGAMLLMRRRLAAA